MMNTQKIIKTSSRVYICFSILSLSYVGLLSVLNPQSTMNLVGVTLPNTDAISSIRGIYGGVGLVITFQLIYLLIKDINKGLLFLWMFWAAYALSRLITIFLNGPLGSFGQQWIVIETIFSLLAIVLLSLSKKYNVR